MARETRGYCLPTEAGMIPRHMRLPHTPAQHPQHFHCCNQKARNPLQQNGGNCLPWGSRETSCGCPACGTIPQGHAQLCRPGDQDCQGETGPQTHKGVCSVNVKQSLPLPYKFAMKSTLFAEPSLGVLHVSYSFPSLYFFPSHLPFFLFMDCPFSGMSAPWEQIFLSLALSPVPKRIPRM